MKILYHENGNALIESALALPVIVTMLLLVMNFGIVLNQDLRVADAARTAAESAVVWQYANNIGYVQQIANLSGTGIPGYNATVANYCTCSNSSSTFSCSSYSDCGAYGLPNRYVKVTTKATLPLLFGVQGFPANINVQSVAIARIAWTGLP